MFLYRAITRRELSLIARSAFRTFPVLYRTTVFYCPDYIHGVEAIACDRYANDKDAEYAGFVVRVAIDDPFVHKLQLESLGRATASEVWVREQAWREFHRRITTGIEIVSAHYGPQFDGEVDPITNRPTDVAGCLPATHQRIPGTGGFRGF